MPSYTPRFRLFNSHTTKIKVFERNPNSKSQPRSTFNDGELQTDVWALAHSNRLVSSHEKSMLSRNSLFQPRGNSTYVFNWVFTQKKYSHQQFPFHKNTRERININNARVVNNLIWIPFDNVFRIHIWGWENLWENFCSVNSWNETFPSQVFSWLFLCFCLFGMPLKAIKARLEGYFLVLSIKCFKSTAMYTI